MLKLAPEKTEAVLKTTKRKIQPISFEISSTTAQISKAIKYLGIWLDTEHVKKVITKAQKTVTTLACLMPNIERPRALKPKVMANVVPSHILYGAPAWYKVTNKKSLKTMFLRVCSVYRTVLTKGIGVVAEIPTIALQLIERYTGIK